ncbi:MAG: purine-nucleoside phosphorylase [Firmicutes bacterium]|nr:purine-nucleoside phosphorylase [Bacillota bacterium]
MSTHINAPEGAIADRVLLPGDPLRAKFIAETYLEEPTCYNEVRGMFGYTGLYKGCRVSVQGTGMGVPSISIYVQELLANYGVRTVMRVGTCGAMQEWVKVRDVILAVAASTDSGTNRTRFGHVDFAPVADFVLLRRAVELAQARSLPCHAGGVYTADLFYNDESDAMKRLTRYGVLAVEMETSALYTLAAGFGARALSILTVSDHLITGEATSAAERQTTFGAMAELALDTIVSEPE